MERPAGEEAVSFIEKDGEWRTRKITLFGVVRSFISEVKIGQDMTRVSLPATLLYPFSMLEVFSARELGVFHLLFPLNTEEDPYLRMLQVVRWSLGFIQQESWHKKPYNPVLGEVLETYNETKSHGKSEFIGEQVSHHPPVSAFIIKNDQENINLECNISFGVKFGNNNVAIVTEGSGFLNIEKRNEQYELVRKTPGMVIKNVIWGTRRMYWAGDVQITCAKTGYTVNLNFGESGSSNVVSGTVSSTDSDGNEEVLCKINGKCGGEVFITDNRSGKKEFFFDAGSIQKPPNHYKTWDQLDPLASQAVWADVNKYSIADDMPNADDCKKKVEQAQRERSNEKKKKGEENVARFFEPSETIWTYKNKKKNSPVSAPVDLSPVKFETEQPLMLSNNALPLVAPELTNQNVNGREELQFNNLGESLDAGRERSNTGGKVSKSTGISQRNLLGKGLSTDKLPKLGQDGKVQRLPDDLNIITGWVKMRNSMKIWINRLFVLRPGKLIYFKDDKEMSRGRCQGIIRLAECHVRTRPTHKDGFSFKIWHNKNYPIYHKYGLKGETLKMAKVPVGWNYCILRVTSESERKAWMDAIEAQVEYANTYDPTPGRGLLIEDVEEDEDSNEQQRRETAEDLVVKNEEFQRILMEGISNQQKTNSQEMQSKTMQTMEEWKKEVDSKLVNMEKRIMSSITNKSGKEDSKLRLNYFQLVGIIVICFLIARFL
eukprot:TRINITY_DN2282_c0_g1_i2.p1 TRINITY_DN2282_c0_g1~~TRINITY_DN2282_c0_g1_i2.p1  ORF type:complete len:716 (-),score=260.67 TRINITY_DN2282_c0_g1_i2:118-2265(-)